jgi:hypothetical protein
MRCIYNHGFEYVEQERVMEYKIPEAAKEKK